MCLGLILLRAALISPRLAMVMITVEVGATRNFDWHLSVHRTHVNAITTNGLDVRIPLIPGKILYMFLEMFQFHKSSFRIHIPVRFVAILLPISKFNAACLTEGSVKVSSVAHYLIHPVLLSEALHH